MRRTKAARTTAAAAPAAAAPPPRRAGRRGAAAARAEPLLALQDFDRALDRAELAVGEAVELQGEAGAAARLASELVAPGIGQAKRESAAVVGVLGPLDQAGANQHVDRAA